MTAAVLLERARSEQGRRALRYSAVSAFNVPFGQGLLILAIHVFDWSWTWSNVFAVSVSSVPAYLLNRYWVWGKKEHNRLLHEIVPFWLAAMLGLVLSTLAVWFVDEQTDAPWAPNAASIGAFGAMWVLKYVFLDRVLFGQGHHHPPELDEPDEVEAGLSQPVAP